MKRRILVFVGCVLLVAFSVSIGFAYTLIKVHKGGEILREVVKYYRFDGADDIAKWWKKNVTEITNCDKEPWVFIVDTKREGMVAGAGDHLTYAKIWNRNIGTRKDLNVKLVRVPMKFRGVVYPAWFWSDRGAKRLPAVTLRKGKRLSIIDIKENAKIAYGRRVPVYFISPEYNFASVYKTKHTGFFIVSKYYKKYDVTLSQLFFDEYCVNAFGQVIADAKRRGIILK